MVFRAGCIYFVRDSLVSMPPEDHRTEHPRRTVLIVSGDDFNADGDWPIVLVCPVSSGEQSGKHDVRLGASVGGLKKKGWVRVALVQPLDKRYIEDWLQPTPIPSVTLSTVHANLFHYIGPKI